MSPELEQQLEKFFKETIITVGKLLTVEEASQILRVTPDTLRRWSRSGKISCVRLSKVDLRYRLLDIHEFILSRLNKRKSVYK
jgi:excisionase family DNA binding protein